MTETNHGTPAVQRSWRSRLIEIGFWIFAPVALLIAGYLAAMVLGAPGPRVVLIGSIITLGTGAYFLWRPNQRFRIGRARGVGLIYAGLFAALIAFSASAPTASAPQGVVQSSATPPPRDHDAEASLYPWPFDAPSVTVACRNPVGRGTGRVTVKTPDGQEYAVNGLARNHYPDVEPIWLDDPETPGLKVSVGDLIQRGLELCLGPQRAAAPLRLVPGVALSPPQQPAQVAETLPTIDDSAFELRIVSAEESGGAVRGQIETNMPLPIEVMVSVSLHGQRDDDSYIGNDQRLRITASPQSFSIPTTTSRGGLPSGQYDVEVAFYPRWGGQNGPPEARAISREIRATRRITLRGTGGSARDAVARTEAQRWLMESTASGDRWNPAEFERRMGPSEQLRVTNRTDIIVAYYFPRADATVFVNTLRNELVTWRLGRHTSL